MLNTTQHGKVLTMFIPFYCNVIYKYSDFSINSIHFARNDGRKMCAAKFDWNWLVMQWNCIKLCNRGWDHIIMFSEKEPSAWVLWLWNNIIRLSFVIIWMNRGFHSISAHPQPNTIMPLYRLVNHLIETAAWNVQFFMCILMNFTYVPAFNVHHLLSSVMSYFMASA